MVSFWPGLAIALLVTAYWGRVVRLVYKTYKRSGHAANFFPTETLGRLIRVLWYPAVLLWIVIPYLAAFGVGNIPGMRFLFSSLIIHWIAVAIALAAFLSTLVCWKRMGKSWRMGIDPGEKTQLIFSGPYAWVRHPIYALQQIFIIASVVAVPAAALVIAALLLLLFLQWEARREESYLVQVHGPLYLQYMQNVGRFVPRSATPYPSASAHHLNP